MESGGHNQTGRIGTLFPNKTSLPLAYPPPFVSNFQTFLSIMPQISTTHWYCLSQYWVIIIFFVGKFRVRARARARVRGLRFYSFLCNAMNLWIIYSCFLLQWICLFARSLILGGEENSDYQFWKYKYVNVFLFEMDGICRTNEVLVYLWLLTVCFFWNICSQEDTYNEKGEDKIPRVLLDWVISSQLCVCWWMLCIFVSYWLAVYLILGILRIF